MLRTLALLGLGAMAGRKLYHRCTRGGVRGRLKRRVRDMMRRTTGMGGMARRRRRTRLARMPGVPI